MIPLPREANDHQRYNAQAMEQWGASKMLLQDTLTSEQLANAVRELYEHRDMLEKMSSCAFEHTANGVASRIIQNLI
jgi:UDP-N-acetylglucosamine--N-acetylmuramyl-(pentapeptide) pyrophosphoryl-undecaprenol N-acetylglucosamine transferase